MKQFTLDANPTISDLERSVLNSSTFFSGYTLTEAGQSFYSQLQIGVITLQKNGNSATFFAEVWFAGDIVYPKQITGMVAEDGSNCFICGSIEDENILLQN